MFFSAADLQQCGVFTDEAWLSAERASVQNLTLKKTAFLMRKGVKRDLSPAAERLLCAVVFVFLAAAGL